MSRTSPSCRQSSSLAKSERCACCSFNEIAAQTRTCAGKRLDSPALIAHGAHVRVDGLVSLAVVGSAIMLGLGLPVGDPIIGLIMTRLVILRITWRSFITVRRDPATQLDVGGEHAAHDQAQPPASDRRVRSRMIVDCAA